MKDISIYFQPSSVAYADVEETIASVMQVHREDAFPDLTGKGIAFIHCPEYRRKTNQPAQSTTGDLSMEALGALHTGESWSFNLYDLGTIRPGKTIQDTSFALKQVTAELVKNKIMPVVIGGSQDLTFAMYEGFQQLEQLVNLTCIDRSLDLGSPEEELAPEGYISRILMHRPCYLFNCSVIGVQAPYVRKKELELFESLYFDVCRLGEFNSDFRKAEPLLRNTDLLSLDLNAIRRSEFDTDENGPNGFYAEQCCQIARYAGISDKLSAFGIFNLPENEKTQAKPDLIAEIIWYFLDGYAQRKGDFPIGTKKDYKRFIVHLDEPEHELIFYKSPRSDRWWMEVPYPDKAGARYERHHLVPCNLEDYEAAMKNEMPDLWWKTYQKLS